MGVEGLVLQDNYWGLLTRASNSRHHPQLKYTFLNDSEGWEGTDSIKILHRKVASLFLLTTLLQYILSLQSIYSTTTKTPTSLNPSSLFTYSSFLTCIAHPSLLENALKLFPPEKNHSLSSSSTHEFIWHVGKTTIQFKKLLMSGCRGTPPFLWVL